MLHVQDTFYTVQAISILEVVGLPLRGHRFRSDECEIYSGTVVLSASQEFLSWSWCVSGMLAKRLMETVFVVHTPML
jgi:hypothetical protein